MAKEFEKLKEKEDDAAAADDTTSESSEETVMTIDEDVDLEWAGRILQANARGRAMQKKYRSSPGSTSSTVTKGFAACTPAEAKAAREYSYDALQKFLLERGCDADEVERCTDVHTLRLFLQDPGSATLRQQVLEEILRSEAEYLGGLNRLKHCFILPIDRHFSLQLLQAGEVMAPKEWEEFKTLVSKFDLVFYCPGNHELWMTKTDTAGSSLNKLMDILELCDRLGVRCRSTNLNGYLSVVPLFSW